MSNQQQDQNRSAEQLADLQPEVQELTAEDAANVQGGLLPAVMPTGELLPAVQSTDLTAAKIMPSQINFQKV